MANRPELVQVRDAVIRHFHSRSSIEELRDVVLDAGRAMQADGLSMEDILAVLKGAVTLAAEHVNRPSTPERAVWLRSQMTGWLISLYMNDSGDFDEPGEL